MAKRMTLRKQAEEYANRVRQDRVVQTMFADDDWLAGHRANRLTRLERAVVEAAKAWKAANTTMSAVKAINEIEQAVEALERAKGRK